MLCCVLWSFLSTGGEVRSADLHPGLPGLPEERRVHLQHADRQKSPSSEAGAPPCGSDGGAGEGGVSVCPLMFTACFRQIKANTVQN